MTTLFDVMLELARSVRAYQSGQATGGTTSTLIDTVARGEEDDAFNGHTVFVLSGDNANTTRRISDFVQSTNTLTVDTAWSNAMADGDRYLISESVREDLVQAINQALGKIGSITQIDDSSLTVVADQTEYDLPSGVHSVARVEIAKSTSGDYNYQAIYTWREWNGKLYLPNGLGYSTGNKIRLFHNSEHSAVSADADVVKDAIPIPLIASIAAYNFLKQQFAISGNASQREEILLNMARDDMYAARQNHRVAIKLHRDPIHRS